MKINQGAYKSHSCFSFLSKKRNDIVIVVPSNTIGRWLGGFIWGWLYKKGGDSRGVTRACTLSFHLITPSLHLINPK